MYEKILVVDDDYGTLKLIETILKTENYVATSFSNAPEALESMNKNQYDLILSDYMMPEMNGGEFLKIVRKKHTYLPFIMITALSDISVAINMIKEGADDYIIKPVSQDDLIFHITKNLEDKKNKKITDRIIKEKEILELENKRMVNWRAMYAAKDIKQTGHLIDLINRNINQGGGFVWLELLKNNIKKIDDKYFQINKSLVDLIIKTTEENKKFFDAVTFIANIENLKLKPELISYDDLINQLLHFTQDDKKELLTKYNRNLVFQRTSQELEGTLEVDMEMLKKIIEELIINAIKYSPEKSDILFGFENYQDANGQYLNLVLKNKPRQINANDTEGNKITGIPYEYSELIFDLFYTIEAFPTHLSEESWVNGTGLYIARTILRKHNAWIKTINEMDYTKDKPTSIVKILISLPLQ
ncbi:MAG: response regulator [Spirochaetes bacterium]|nr:response regulator [Spirochaetota bacterium]